MSDTVWRKKSIEAEKAKIFRELESSQNRLPTLLKKLEQTQDESSSLSKLRAYIYCVAALYENARNGGLKAREVQKLAKLAKALVMTQKIKPTSSRLGFLYGDIYVALSMTNRRLSRHREAAWEQQLSFYLSQRSPSGGPGYQALSMGIQAMRAGNAPIALNYYEKAWEHQLTPKLKSRLFLETIKAYRLSGNGALAKQCASKHQDSIQWDTASRLEWTWEQLWLALPDNGDLQPILQKVRKGGSHNKAVYLLEAFLVSRSVQSKNWMERFGNFHRWYGKTKKDFKIAPVLYEASLCIEQCYDATIPYAIRLERLGETLAQAHRLPTIEHELLFWGATLRWLHRAQARGFTQLALAEYQSINWKLSSGQNCDVLGLLADVTTGDLPKLEAA